MAEYLFCVETKLNCDLRHFISSVCAGEVNSVDLVVINIICEGFAPVDTEINRYRMDQYLLSNLIRECVHCCVECDNIDKLHWSITVS